MKFNKEEIVDALITLVSDEDGLKGTINALEFQANKAEEFLSQTSLLHNIEDKDDKTFDRAKFYLRELPSLRLQIIALKKSVIPVESTTTIDANKNSVLSFLDKQ